LDIESHSKYRKYKKAALMACSINPISQSNLGISPIWIPIISNEVNISHRRSVWCDRCSFVSIRFFRVESHGFIPQVTLVVGTVLASSPFKFMHWCSWACFVR
jgi:hypothetical protein